MNYLKFIKYSNKLYNIYNKKEIILGSLEFLKVGRYNSWVLSLKNDCYLSASCIDEVRAKIRELNREER